MEKFKDYNASQITPQMTLIKKFDALLKWMKENSDKFYKNVFDVNADMSFDLEGYFDISKIQQSENKKVGVDDLLIFRNFGYSFVTAVANGKVYYQGGQVYTPPEPQPKKIYRHKVMMSYNGSFSDEFTFLSFSKYPITVVSDLSNELHLFNGHLISTLISSSSNVINKFEFFNKNGEYMYELITTCNYSTNTTSYTMNRYNVVEHDEVDILDIPLP